MAENIDSPMGTPGEPGRFEGEPVRATRDRPLGERETVRATRDRPLGERESLATGRRTGATAERRRGPWRRRRSPAAAALGTLGAGILALARLVMTVASLIALLIVLAIVLRDVDANASNSIVKGVHEGANFFAGAFTDLIKFTHHPKRAITVNWGIAAVVYLLVGGLIAGLIARVGRGGIRFERARSAAPIH